jgi:metal-responsive CopG/Arc/MetJ family transcriptional regulator
MGKKHMKRVNVILETDLYDKARVVAFVKKKSLSEIVRNALREWLTVHIDSETELILSEKDERRLLRILTTDEFIPLEQVKKSLGL